MKHLETTYTAHDGYELYLQAWLCAQPKASLLLVHGLGEHSGRYAHLVERLGELGVSVFTFDGRGHGKSAKGKPDAYFDSCQDYLKDIDALFGKVKSYVPGVPAFLYGHSMGGGLVAMYALDFKPEVAGVILSSAAIKEGEGTSKLLIAIAGLMSKFLPRLKVLKLETSKLTRVPAEVEKYTNDPLVYSDSVPARTGSEVLLLMQKLQARASEFVYPALVIHGSEDGLTNPKGSEIFAQNASSKDMTYRVFEGGYHELINDLDAEEVLDVICGWIVERI